MDDAARSAGQYDAMAAAYSADNVESPYNAYYERPATKALLGDVEGRRVLEVGCGSGVLTAWLAEQGAAVTAFDVSPEMVALATVAAGDGARLLIADLGAPLTFAADDGYDLVVASLALHYVRDWHAMFAELHRVLVPGGRVVFSTHHPTMDWAHSPDDYFATKQITERWQKGSGEYDVTFWRRPLTAMTEAIAGAGFVIERLEEPLPGPELRERDRWADTSIRTSPRFLFFRLRAE